MPGSKIPAGKADGVLLCAGVMRQPLKHLQYLSRIQNIQRIQGPLDGFHHIEFSRVRQLGQLLHLFGPDAVFPAELAAQGIDVLIGLFVEGIKGFFTFTV